VIDKLQTRTELANPNAHDSAAVLVTPGLARLLTVDGVLGDLASYLAGSAVTGRFHLLTAVVDRVAPPTASDGPIEGISIVRGRQDEILPQLWQPSPRKAVQESDAVGALTFGLGDICTTTVPLARTIFQNSRTSTLLVSSFGMSQDSPKLVESMEAQTRHISLPVSALASSASDLQMNYYLPMLPLTGPRFVTESFGNIVRGIKVDGKTAPASTELEEAVNKMYARPTHFTEATTASVKVFALVTPSLSNSPFENRRPEPSSWLEQKLQPKELSRIVSRNSRYLEEAYLNGGRLYQLCE
jgi:hypothetical protein